MAKGTENFLTRSGLRDVVILLSLASALYYPVTKGALIGAVILLVAGSFLHYLTKGVLIRNEVLCKDGIYSIVRHPYYMANYLIDLSFCLFSGNPYLLLAYPFLFFWSYGPTFRMEEKTLKEKHGDASTVYMLATPPVFPDRQSIRRVGQLFEGFSSKRISRKEIARIVRFYAMAALILVLHNVRWQDLRSEGLSFLFDASIFLLLLLAVLFYCASLMILASKRG